MKLICDNCNQSFELDRKKYRTRNKINKHFYCSLKCSHDHRYPSRKQKESNALVYKENHPDGMRNCCKCGPKPIEFFGMRDKTKKRYQSICKPCLYTEQMLRWNKIKCKAIEYMGGKCIDCGCVDHPCVYDFHHVNSKNKDAEWHRLRQKKWESITKELAKCILLCCKCHRKRHSASSSWSGWRDSNPQVSSYPFNCLEGRGVTPGDIIEQAAKLR